MTIQLNTAAHCLAMLRSRQAVKRELQAQGLKPAQYAAREITALASQYLSEHRSELMPDAMETVTRWTLAGEFGKRAQRAAQVFVKSTKIEHSPNANSAIVGQIVND